MYGYKPFGTFLLVWMEVIFSFGDTKVAIGWDAVENLFNAGDIAIECLAPKILFDSLGSILLLICPECSILFTFKASDEFLFKDDDETNAELIAKMLLLGSLEFVTPGWLTGQLGAVDINLRCPYGQHR